MLKGYSIVVCFCMFAFVLCSLGCRKHKIANDVPIIQIPKQFPNPEPQPAPSDWPNPLATRDKSGNEYEHDPYEFYNRWYRTGWDDYFDAYPPDDLDLKFRGVSGFAWRAIGDGYKDCENAIAAFEKLHGQDATIKLVNDYRSAKSD